MKYKNLYALFLLSIASVYFICPVQCASPRETGENATSDTVSSHRQHLAGAQTTDEKNQSTCCRAENQPSSPHDNQEDGEGHCCLNQWESLGESEPQLVSQIQTATFSFVVVIPATPKISSGFVSFTPHFYLPDNPYTNPSTLQLSPRAPPLSLA